MKLAIRIFALTVVVAGVTAAATTAKSSVVVPSHQSASAAFPVAQCGPHLPGCVVSPSGN